MKHVLVEIQPPQRELRKCIDTVCMHLVGREGVPTQLVCDDFHPNGRLFRSMSLKGGERAIILSIRLVYCSNNTGRDVHLQICNLFDADAAAAAASLEVHPEKTGTARVVLPARHRGEMPKRRQLVYEPNLVNLGINVLHYAGLEDSIECARSSAVYPGDLQKSRREFELFKMSDPLLVFALQHRNHFPDISAQDIVQFKDGYYKMKQSAADRVRFFFKKTVFPLFHYTRPEHVISLTWNPEMQPPPALPPHLLLLQKEDEEAATAAAGEEVMSGFAMIVFTLEMEYIVVTPNLAGFGISERPLF